MSKPADGRAIAVLRARYVGTWRYAREAAVWVHDSGLCVYRHAEPLKGTVGQWIEELRRCGTEEVVARRRGLETGWKAVDDRQAEMFVGEMTG